MSELVLWLGLLLLVFVGAAITRFNPAVMYSRSTLIRLVFVAVLVIGVLFMLDFFEAPAITRSGVFNVNGG
jgi:hypothetical protein